MSAPWWPPPHPGTVTDIRQTFCSSRRYYRLRAAVYTHVPGLVDFYDVDTLRRLVEDGGLSAVRCTTSSSSVDLLARA